jgi:hypothetical protein
MIVLLMKVIKAFTEEQWQAVFRSVLVGIAAMAQG